MRRARETKAAETEFPFCITAPDFVNAANDFLAKLENASFESFRTIRHICRLHRFLFCDRNLPLRILEWIDRERNNPHFEIDTSTSPHQVTLSKTRTIKLLMYVWFRPSSYVPSNVAHDHSSVGVSLIHTGHCYEERVYVQQRHGKAFIDSRYRGMPGDVRIIRPETMHIVEPVASGGFSFIVWGPRVRHTTTVLNIVSGERKSEESEHVDNVNTLLTVAEALSERGHE